MEPKWLTWAKQIQAISQTGLAYGRDVYDIERFEQLRDLSITIMQEYTGMETDKLRSLFAAETGYATPKVDVRGVVFRNDEILLVKEKSDGAWALPGGWADIGLSPAEVAVKEVREESGFEVRAAGLMGILDKKFHNHPPDAYHIYKIFIHCEITGGSALEGVETSGVGFFKEDSLPALSISRNTEAQIKRCFDYYRNPEQKAWLD